MNGQETTTPVTESDPVSQEQPVTNAAPIPAGRDWQGSLVFVAGVGALLWGIVSALGAGWGAWEWSRGLTGVLWSFILAIGAILFGILFGWRARKSGIARPRFLRWIGMLAAIVYAGWIGTFILAGASVPAIHDLDRSR
jgi:hypothetical protein